MNKSILCPIDFSESSAKALKWAADLSSRYKCHLTILYPYRLLHTTTGDVIQYKKKNEELAIKKFAVLEKNYLQGKDISFEFNVEVGFINDRVDYYLKKEAILMLVIGRDMNIQNNENMEEFLRHTDVPVLVIP